MAELLWHIATPFTRRTEGGHTSTRTGMSEFWTTRPTEHGLTVYADGPQSRTDLEEQTWILTTIGLDRDDAFRAHRAAKEAFEWPA